MKCLMVAFAFVLPYHVMRTAAAAGHEVHVLGNGPAAGLRWSRHCASFRESGVVRPAEDGDLVRAEIAAAVRSHGIELVLPSDDVSTRLLAGIGAELPAPTSLLPDPATFDLLNDKWRFTRFGTQLGVAVPQGWCFRDAAGLLDALKSGEVRLPLTAKPASRSGSVGVVHLLDEADLPSVASIDYRPVVVQRYVRGETIGISAVCRHGEILAHAAQRRDERRFELLSKPDLLRDVGRLMAATDYSGPVNFDVVVEDESGTSYIVECNPRFWYSIYLPMLLGHNFVDAAIGASLMLPAVGGRLCLSLSEILRHPARASRHDWALLRYHLDDPLSYVALRTHWFADAHVSVASPPPDDRLDRELPPARAQAAGFAPATVYAPAHIRAAESVGTAAAADWHG